MVAKKPSKHGRAWSPTDVRELKGLARENTPTRVIGLKLNRTEAAVRSKASTLDVSLKPVNQSPYNRSPKVKPSKVSPKPKPAPVKLSTRSAGPRAPKPKGTRSTGPRAAKKSR